MRPGTLVALAAGLALAACGYFNAMYNAERRYSDAEQASARGDPDAARRAWLDAIDGAASSYRSHPDGRWADDALLLIARARFRLGEHEAARAAARSALAAGNDPATQAGARMVLGASEFRLGRVATARAVLDTALAGPQAGDPETRLWRARARFALGDAGAWDDLDRVASAGGELGAEAAVEAATRALEQADAERFAQAGHRLVTVPEGARFADTLLVLVERAVPIFGQAAAPFADLEHSPWPAARREPLELERAASLARSGDTAAAVSAALRLASRSSAAIAARARLLAARLDVSRVASVPDLERVRATLLPALANDSAREMLRTLRVVEVLLDRAGQGQPLALFAAAELTRDGLQAKTLAHELFLAYADLVPDAIWAPKALLAAADLRPAAAGGPGIAERFAGHADNVYVRAVLHDEEPDAYSDAEERLARGLAAVRADAFREADQRDIRVGTAVARLDSLRARVEADSMRLLCGTLLDSLAIAGIRADSVRSACLRGDTARVGAVLRMDTLLLRDTARARVRRRTVQDTFPLGPR